MRRQLARILGASPWLVLLVGIASKGQEDHGLRMILALFVWIAIVAFLVLLAGLVELAKLKDRPERDDRRE